MAVGNEAKERLINRFAEAVGADYIGMYDKKYYFWSEERGERKQVAVSLTCPKINLEVANNINDTGDWDWGGGKKDLSAAVPIASAGPAEITDEEVDNIKTLFEKLGL